VTGGGTHAEDNVAIQASPCVNRAALDCSVHQLQAKTFSEIVISLLLCSQDVRSHADRDRLLQ